jgi:hypothetical protein
MGSLIIFVAAVGAVCVGIHKAFPPPLPPGTKPLEWTEGEILFMALLLGAGIGGLVGFLLRPSVPLIGQLPFETVVTRGSDLTGLDLLLRGAAETSFNYMLVGAIVGAVLGWLVKQQLGKKAA